MARKTMTIAKALSVAVLAGVVCGATQAQTAPQTPSPASSAPSANTPQTTPAPPAKPPVAPAKKGKEQYTGPTAIVVLPPTPMLDGEGKQRVDPDGKLMFNPAVKQMRDKKGHPVFDESGKPVFQTATDLGYDEKGKKLVAKKEKPPKMTPVSISAGTLTVDGWTGKARLNYDVADLKFLYIYAPGIGTTIVSQNQFPGSKEQPGAFNQKTLKITVDGHAIELYSEKPMLGKKPESAWVVVDRNFSLPSKFPVLGYGAAVKSPYVWPGAKETAASKGPIQAPPLPTDVRPTLLLAPCPVGMMRAAAPPALPGQKAPEQPCVPIKPDTPATANAAPPAPQQ
jgi:hypothetical protein